MKGLILDPACVSCGKYLIFRPKGREYGLIWFTRTMLVTVHYLLHMQFSPQSNKRTSGAIKPLNPITQTALSHQANCFNWNKELIKAKKYELLALNWATQTLFYAGFLLYYCTACEATVVDYLCSWAWRQTSRNTQTKVMSLYKRWVQIGWRLGVHLQHTWKQLFMHFH